MERQNATQTEVNDAIVDFLSINEIEFKLLKYGIYRLNKYFSYKYDIHKGINGILLEDIIGDTIESFVTGKRKWYKDRFPDFQKQFMSAYDSAISNTMSKNEIIPSKIQIDDLKTDILDNESDYDSLLDFCIVCLKGMNASDEELLLFEPYIVQQQKRAEIAKDFGIEEKELTNIKKRLDRKIPILNGLLKQYLNE